MSIALLQEQNELAAKLGPVCRFLAYRCAALTAIKSAASSSSSSALLSSHHHGSAMAVSSVDVSGGPHQQQHYSALHNNNGHLTFDDTPIHQHKQQGATAAQQQQPRHVEDDRPATSTTRSHSKQRDRVMVSSVSDAIDGPADAPTTTTLPVLDIDAITLKMPGDVAPNFANAVTDATSGGGIVAHEAPMERAVCTICQRMFAVDRLRQHQTACRKANAKDRKAFDMRTHRVKATYVENQAEDDADRALRNVEEGGDEPPGKKGASVWRQQSAALQYALKSERGGAGAGDQPVDDRVPCNGCGKRFAPATAATHVPWCMKKAAMERR